MESVYLKISDCRQCPHRDHKGGFARISYIPTCRKAQRDLPYTIAAPGTARLLSAAVVAVQVEGIPDWCPLRETVVEASESS